MPVYNIGICDDDKNMCCELESMLIDIFREFNVHVEIEPWYSGETLCKHLEMGNAFDFLFLDIELLTFNGCLLYTSPDPFKQNAAQPFRQVKKGHDQIDLFLLPAGNRFDIAADNKWNQHPEEPCHNAGKQHEPEVQRIFHFCFYVLFLHFQKYLYHFSLLQLSGFCGCFCRTIHAAPVKCRSRRIGRRIPCLLYTSRCV